MSESRKQKLAGLATPVGRPGSSAGLARTSFKARHDTEPRNKNPTFQEPRDEMNSICGIIQFDQPIENPDRIRKMAAALPYSSSSVINCQRARHAHLAQSRFSRDRNKRSHYESHFDSSERFSVLTDARIDNHVELARQLSAKGFLSDTNPSIPELLIAAYHCWGSGFAQHLLGDFAVAVWDEQRKRLVAARDPMAMRGLYYAPTDNGLLLASEIKQILAVTSQSAGLNEAKIGAFLCGDFSAPKKTFYKGIYEVPPAHSLTGSADGIKTRRYWDIDPSHRITYSDEREYLEHFRQLFSTSVRCRLEPYDSCGILLSGGLDSGGAASMAGQLREEGDLNGLEIRTYSWAFPTLEQCDEREISRPIVDRYDLSATSINAEAEPLFEFPMSMPDEDEPFSGIYYRVIDRALQQARSDGATVILTGHRGDLLFGDWIFGYAGLLLSLRWHRLWNEISAHSQRTNYSRSEVTGKYLWPGLKQTLWPRNRAVYLREPLRRAWQYLSNNEPHGPSYPSWVNREYAREIGLDDDSFEPSIGAGDIPVRGTARRQRYRSVFTPMHMRMAAWMERTYRKQDLTHADPWADRRLVEFALAIPQDVINQAGDNKYLTRQALKGIMPEETRRQARKVSPKPLYDRNLRNDARPVVEQLLERPVAEEFGFVDGQALNDYFEGYWSGDDEDYRMWYTLTLEMWLRQYG